MFFILLMIGVTSKEIVHFAAFKLNQDFITDFFCINKDKPEMQCDGKCYLKKTIDTANEESNSSPVTPPDERSLIVFLDVIEADQNSLNLFDSWHRFFYLATELQGTSQELIHPPEVLS